MTGTLRDQLAGYPALRRALGYRLARPEKLLNQFLDHLDRAGTSRVTVAVALDWARLPANGGSNWWAYRLSAVRGFAAYLHVIDPVHEVPAADLLPQRPLRASPYLYSDADIAALIAATRALCTPLRQATFATLIGLLAVTGIRVGEAIALDRGDVDLASGRLVVRHGKFGKARELTLHPTTVTALRRYQRLRDRSAPATGTAAFFVSRPEPGRSTATSTTHSTGSSIWRVSRRGERRAGPASTTCGTLSRSRRCSTPTPPARTGRPG